MNLFFYDNLKLKNTKNFFLYSHLLMNIECSLQILLNSSNKLNLIIPHWKNKFFEDQWIYQVKLSIIFLLISHFFFFNFFFSDLYEFIILNFIIYSKLPSNCPELIFKLIIKYLIFIINPRFIFYFLKMEKK